MSKVPPKIEIHRLKFHKNEKRGPFVVFTDLDDADKHVVSVDLFKQIYINSGKKDPYAVCAEVFFNWGIMCSHPQEKRLYDGKTKSYLHPENSKWFRCALCECDVICSYSRPAKNNKSKSLF